MWRPTFLPGVLFLFSGLDLGLLLEDSGQVSLNALDPLEARGQTLSRGQVARAGRAAVRRNEDPPAFFAGRYSR